MERKTTSHRTRKEMKVDRRVKFTWAARIDRTEIKKKRNEKKEVTADPLTPDTFLLTDSVELCASAYCYCCCVTFLQQFLHIQLLPLVLLYFDWELIDVQWLANLWIGNRNFVQPEWKTNIVDFNCKICMWGNSVVRCFPCDAMWCDPITSTAIEMSWLKHKILNRTHRNSFACHQPRLIKPYFRQWPCVSVCLSLSIFKF